MGLKSTTQALTYARTELIKVGESFIFDKVGDMIYAAAVKPNLNITGTNPERQMYWQFTATELADTNQLQALQIKANWNGAEDTGGSAGVTGAEIKARHTTGNAYTIGQLRGVVGNADTKNSPTTTAYGVEGSIDVGAGGTIGTAACFHGNLNNSGDVTDSYGAYLEGVSGYNLGTGVYVRYADLGLNIENSTKAIAATIISAATDPGRMVYLQFTSTAVGPKCQLQGMQIKASWAGITNSTQGGITGAEIKARASDDSIDSTLGQARGIVANVDCKKATFTTGYALEAAVDIAAGGTITTAAGVRSFLNNSGSATSYGVMIEGVAGYDWTSALYVKDAALFLTIEDDETVGHDTGCTGTHSCATWAEWAGWIKVVIGSKTTYVLTCDDPTADG